MSHSLNLAAPEVSITNYTTHLVVYKEDHADSNVTGATGDLFFSKSSGLIF